MKMARISIDVGQINCHIFAGSAGVPTGSALVTANNTVDVSTLNNENWPNGDPPTDVTYTFAEFPLSAATQYFIVLSTTGFSGLAISVITGVPSTGYNVYGSPDGVTWPGFTYPDYRFYFRIFGVAP